MSESHVDEATADQKANVKDASERALHFLVEGAEKDLPSYYAAAVIAHDVKSNAASYGKAGVETFAELVGHDKSSVYKWIKVAKAFDQATITAVLEKKDKFGRSLSWSHVSVCASVPTQEKILLDRALNESLSVAELRKIAADGRRGKKKVVIPSLRAVLTELVKHLQRVTECAMRAKDCAPISSASSEDAKLLRALLQTVTSYGNGLPPALVAMVDLLEPRPGLTRAPTAKRALDPDAASRSRRPDERKGSRKAA